VTATATYAGRDPATGKGVTLQVADGVISAARACAADDLPILTPGFVDLQVNGFRGHDLNGGGLEADEVEALSKALAHVGVSIYLPTLITAREDTLCQALAAIRVAQATLPYSGRMIAGIHVEGPAISPKDGPRGAHPLEHVRPPSTAEFDRWQQAAGGLVRMITLAPEAPGAADYIRYVTDRGICVALGHCDPEEDDIDRAARAGARMSTHLGNGIASTLPRHPNPIWAQLSDDRLSASFILDGHHLPRAAARAMIRAKGPDRAILVSDSVTFAGMPPGRYASPIGGEVDVDVSGRVSVAGTPYLAGSGACLLDIVCGYEAFTGLPFADAARMACHNPARILGRSADLSPGAAADFILFDRGPDGEAARVRDIVFGGRSHLQ